MSSKINYKRVWSTSDAGLTFRVSTLENNEYKITYFESVSAATGTITNPAQSTILLDQFFSGIDAYVSTIVNGQPTGILPQTSGGSPVDVSTFDALGNYTLTGTPSAFPVAIIYVLKIKAIYYSNLNVNNILELEGSGSGGSGGGGISSKSVTFDGQGGVININTKATFNIDFTGTITGWQLFEISDTPISSTCVIDVWKDTYANYPPTVADTIFGTKPSLTAGIKNESTGLSIAVTTGDTFIVNIDSNTNAVRLLLVLQFNIT